MQVFLPYANFQKSVQCLDNKRLCKQRIEAKQIIEINLRKIRNPDEYIAWQNHPAVLMWRSNDEALKLYYNCCVHEWLRRGFKNSMSLYNDSIYLAKRPFWFGDERFHSAHRSALLAKNYDHYKQFNWSEEPKIDYYWPVKKDFKQIMQDTKYKIEKKKLVYG
jgi:hypothetical protein